jgi:hypothetical protein
MFLPNFGPFGDARVIADLAERAEAAGWDGFFIWDHMVVSTTEAYPVADPWIALAAAAMVTDRVRLGALVTPLSRRRPWKVARETVTLDRLSGGRLVFGAGLGYPPDAEFAAFAEEDDARARARILDEGLDLLNRLWSGAEVTASGEHYQVGPVTFQPVPVQRPRIPVWIGGWWPNRPPFRRAARWDGVYPELDGGGLPSVAQIEEILGYIRQYRDPALPFDVAVNGHDCWSRRRDLPAYANAGLTWWLERIDPDRAFSVSEANVLIDKGPPAG